MAVEALSIASQAYERSTPENPLTHAKAPTFDQETDQKIQALFQFKTFTKEIIEYVFEEKKYPILVLHNPENLPLWGGKGYPALPVQRISAAIISKSPLPAALEKKLRQLLPSDLKKSDEIPSLDHLNFHWYHSLVPAEICPENQITYFDAQIKALLATQAKVEKFFIYHYKNEIYRLRLEADPSIRWWGYKFRFHFDKPVHYELKDHLCNIAYSCLSWWSYFHQTLIEEKEDSFIKTQYFAVFLDTKSKAKPAFTPLLKQPLVISKPFPHSKRYVNQLRKAKTAKAT